MILLPLAALLAFAAGDLTETQVRDGLPHVVAKLRAGGEVRIAYFGGSITAAEGWRPQTARQLQERYPKATIVPIAASIGGTGSDLGAFRFRRDVLEKKPDLVFVEFAVNDSGTAPRRVLQSMEGIVRQAWSANPDLDLCFVYTLKEDMVPVYKEGKLPRSQEVMERVAQRYGIPSVNFGIDVVRREQAGTLVFKAPKPGPAGKLLFSSDGVHPHVDSGHPVYAEALDRAWTEIEPKAAGPTRTLGEPLDKDNWEQARMIPIGEAKRSDGWTSLDPQTSKVAGWFRSLAPAVWRADRAGESIRFRYRGLAAGISHIVGPDSGQLQISIDGGAPATRSGFDPYCTYHRLNWFLIGEGLPAGEHAVTVSIHPDAPDKAAILAKGGGKIDDPKKFEGTAFYPVYLLLLGELLP